MVNILQLLTILTHIYPYLPIFTHTYPYLPILTHTYPYLPILTHTYPYLPIFTPIHQKIENLKTLTPRTLIHIIKKLKPLTLIQPHKTSYNHLK